MSICVKALRGLRPNVGVDSRLTRQRALATGLNKPGADRSAVMGKTPEVNGTCGTTRSSSGRSPFKPGAVEGRGIGGQGRAGSTRGQGLHVYPMGSTKGR
jgi:hypothetical protein